jgi:hypothetical protein
MRAGRWTLATGWLGVVLVGCSHGVGAADLMDGSPIAERFRQLNRGSVWRKVDEVRLDFRTYHPGGIDFDGRWIWVPVAEYRAESRSVVYRVDPRSLEAVNVFGFADHLGALVYDGPRRALVGVSWGSRRYYRWELREGGNDR